MYVVLYLLRKCTTGSVDDFLTPVVSAVAGVVVLLFACAMLCIFKRRARRPTSEANRSDEGDAETIPCPDLVHDVAIKSIEYEDSFESEPPASMKPYEMPSNNDVTSHTFVHGSTPNVPMYDSIGYVKAKQTAETTATEDTLASYSYVTTRG